MVDSLIYDVKDLLDIGKGDERILKQILRACENNEVVSNYERGYVKRLAKKHLDKKSDISDSPKIITPQNISKPSFPNTAITIAPPTVKPAKKNTNLVIVGIILALVAITAVAFYATQPPLEPTPSVPTSPMPTSPITLSIQTDLPSYNIGDLISINGISPIPGTVNLSITNHNDQLIWSDEITVKDNNTYSTLAIAGGNGWDESGTFTITAQNNSDSTYSTFLFNYSR